MGSKLLNAYTIMRINALRIALAPVLTNTPFFQRTLISYAALNFTPRDNFNMLESAPWAVFVGIELGGGNIECDV